MLTAPATGAPPAADGTGDGARRLWIERLRLTDFRNYAQALLDLDARPVVLTGPNGSGKTNLLEAVSLLAPGRGLRRAPFSDLLRAGADASSGWTVAARVQGAEGRVEIGTGYAGEDETAGRAVRIDGRAARGSGTLGAHMRMVWLTPAMDGLFTGAAGDRRRFLDRLIQSLDAGHAAALGRFERAMRQRNRLLVRGARAAAEFEGLELQMAETGVAIAAARAETVHRLKSEIGDGGEESDAAPFPWATLALEGTLETRIEREAAVDIEDGYRAALAASRDRDRAAGRTLDGPHRSDLVVGHGPGAAPARRCSTGEQKALLIGLVLAHARLVKHNTGSMAPLVLLDEIAAHLDEVRRAALFAEITRLELQAWMTGTDAELFASLGPRARFLAIENGGVRE